MKAILVFMFLMASFGFASACDSNAFAELTEACTCAGVECDVGKYCDGKACLDGAPEEAVYQKYVDVACSAVELTEWSDGADFTYGNDNVVTCTQVCATHDECAGFNWSGVTCTFLTGEITTADEVSTTCYRNVGNDVACDYELVHDSNTCDAPQSLAEYDITDDFKSQCDQLYDCTNYSEDSSTASLHDGITGASSDSGECWKKSSCYENPWADATEGVCVVVNSAISLYPYYSWNVPSIDICKDHCRLYTSSCLGMDYNDVKGICTVYNTLESGPQGYPEENDGSNIDYVSGVERDYDEDGFVCQRYLPNTESLSLIVKYQVIDQGDYECASATRISSQNECFYYTTLEAFAYNGYTGDATQSNGCLCDSTQCVWNFSDLDEKETIDATSMGDYVLVCTFDELQDYEYMEAGASICTDDNGVENTDAYITNSMACLYAVVQLGFPSSPFNTEPGPTIPTYCSTRTTVIGGSTQQSYMHFNTDLNGAGREDLHPVCKVFHDHPHEAGNPGSHCPEGKHFFDMDDCLFAITRDGYNWKGQTYSNNEFPQGCYTIGWDAFWNAGTDASDGTATLNYARPHCEEITPPALELIPETVTDDGSPRVDVSFTCTLEGSDSTLNEPKLSWELDSVVLDPTALPEGYTLTEEYPELFEGDAPTFPGSDISLATTNIVPGFACTEEQTCPSGYRDMTEAECRFFTQTNGAAMHDDGVAASFIEVVDDPTFPTGCYQQNANVYYNNNREGAEPTGVIKIWCGIIMWNASAQGIVLGPTGVTQTLTVSAAVQETWTAEVVFKCSSTENPDDLEDTSTVEYTDLPPEFDEESYSFTIREDASGGVLVTVSATDDHDTVAYSMTGGVVNGVTLFTIDTVSGGISYSGSGLDAETETSYSLAVTATDGADPAQATSVSVTVTVTDVNDVNPVFSPDTITANVPENTPIDDVVVTITDASDGDLTSPNHDISTYAITDVSPQEADGLFALVGMEIQVASAIDREAFDGASDPVVTLTVTATDAGTDPSSLSGDLTIEITITDENDNDPMPDPTSITISVPENTPIGTAITGGDNPPLPTCSDADATSPNNAITEPYTIISGNDDGLFVIVDSEIQVADTIDYESLSSTTVTLEVECSDQGTPSLSSVITVTIDITDENDDNPTPGEVNIDVTIPENKPIGELVTSISICTDTDSTAPNNEIASYAITAGNDEGLFVLDGTNLNVASEIDLESLTANNVNNPIVLTITCADNGTPSLTGTGTITVTITDVNDEEPVPDPPTITVDVPENTSTGTSIVSLPTCTDGDVSNPNNLIHGYTIISGNDDDLFEINSDDDIAVKNAIDYETVSSTTVTLTVQCSDQGDPTLSGEITVTINITDENDNTPTPGEPNIDVSIPENTPTGDLVVAVSICSDADSTAPNNQIASYTITAGNDQGLFVLDGTNLNVASEIDLESLTANNVNNPIVLTISCTDDGGPPLTGDGTITITITDENDEPPVANPGDDVQVTIEENTSVGHVVTDLTALFTDGDGSPPNNVIGSYNIVTVTPEGGVGLFQITGSDVTVAISPDAENDPGVVTLVIEATDGGTPPMTSDSDNSQTVVITITDVNDLNPYFTSTPYEVEVPATTSVGDVVLTVTADDDDLTSPNHDIVSFTITAGNDDSAWAIDGSTGEISVANTLDPSVNSYTLTVTVTDGGTPALTGTTTVEITVPGDKCKDVCPSTEPDFEKYHICEEVDGQTETSIWFCAEIMGHPQYRIISGEVQANDIVTFSIYVPEQVILEGIDFVGGNGDGSYDPDIDIDSQQYWSLEDNYCNDILTFTGPLADLENGLTYFQVDGGYLIFMITTYANQDVMDMEGNKHNRQDTFVSSASILLETDLTATATFSTYTEVVAEFYDSEFEMQVPEIYLGGFIVPVSYCVDIKHTNGITVDTTSIVIDETTLSLKVDDCATVTAVCTEDNCSVSVVEEGDYGIEDGLCSCVCEETAPDRRRLGFDPAAYEASEVFSYGTVYATAATDADENCQTDDEWCYSRLCVTIIKSDCKMDEALKVGFNLIGGYEPYHFEDSYRVIADTCPVEFTGSITPAGTLTFYNMDPSDSSAATTNSYIHDATLYGQIGINAHAHAIEVSSVTVTSMKVTTSDGTEITLTDSGDPMYTAINDGSTSATQDFSIELTSLGFNSASAGKTHSMSVEFTVTYGDTWGEEITVEDRRKLKSGVHVYNAKHSFTLISRKRNSINRLLQ